MRRAAKDFATYSSELLGDRDVRSYRQLPLEADPPRHTNFREAVQPLFMSDAIGKHRESFAQLAKNLVRDIAEIGRAEISQDFALPYVIGCLTIIYNRPQDFDEWLSWGPDVWTAESYRNGALEEHSVRSGIVLQTYLDKVFNFAEANINEDPKTQDVWDYVAQIHVNGRKVSREEMCGIANVLLAGGRDTVIKLVTGLIWHLIKTPSDREFLASHAEWFNRTIAEIVRYLSPLPKMERVLVEDIHIPDSERDTSKYVLLSFVSANHDRDIWPDADVLNIHRDRKPHLAFGFGRHSCMGMSATEHEVGALLSVLLDCWPNWEFDREPEIKWAISEGKDGERIHYIDRFVKLNIKTG